MTPRLVLTAIVVAGAVVRLWGLGSESLWHDEAWTWYLVRDSLGDLFHRVTKEDAHPPLYFLMAWPWAKVGDSETLLRLPSALLGIASLPLVYRLGRVVAGTGAGLLATAFIAFAPIHVKYSQEARSYALLFFLCTLSLTILVAHRERPRWLLLGIVSAAILYTEYLGAFFLLGEAALLAAWSRRNPALARGSLRAAIVALAFFLPWTPFAFHHVFKIGGGFWMERTSLHVLGSEFARLLAFPYGFVDTLKTVSWAAVPAGAAVAALLVAVTVALRKRAELRPWALLVGIPIAAMAVAGLLLPIFCARGLIYVLAPLAVLAAAAETRWRWAAAAVIILGTLPGIRFFNHALERENWRDAVGYFRSHAESEDPVLVYPGYLRVNALYYLRHSPRRIITVGESGNYSLEEIRTHEKKDPVVWVIRRTYSDRDELLDLYAETHSVQEERRWQHVAVLRLERRIQR